MASTGIETVTAALAETALDDITTRHRRERKDLQAKIQALKKNAPKNDKKKRKEAMEEVARLETELEQRHATELKASKEQEQLQQSNDNNDSTANSTIELSASSNDTLASEISGKVGEESTQQQRVSKAQKRRDKKAREAREREDEIRAAAEDALYSPKAIEARQMQLKLKERKLALYQIASDGDCLYNAIRHQLIHNHLGSFTVEHLRCEAANYIRAHKDALICYMTNPQTGELLNNEEFEKYCHAVKTTPAWGGQIELKALSSVLKVPIEVLQAEGPSTVQGAEEFGGPNLIITYHRYMYSLGEHYNSTIPMTEVPQLDE